MPLELQNFSLNTFLTLWPEQTELNGIVLFGSRAKEMESQSDSDWDIGVIYSGKRPMLEIPPMWDLFLWEKSHWENGFVLQLEMAGYAKILLDPENIIQARFEFLREKILPHWAGYLRRL